ncbi:type II toxin-antitoxin system RatA family toxin [Arenimonas sp. MALMAid1274]|uniref:type II toxin-antitoxin system RatA family toxin n=1 Tax=Arenimonas sp. MALMAid1274 TaxID=3411630 RepID=UPI003B9F1228
MTSIHRHALVRHSALRMYTLVNDVAAYPARFSWCEDAEVLESSDTHMLARLDLTVAGLRTSFTTRNTLSAPTRIELKLVEGPFRKFTGLWQFHSLAEDACKVSLSLDFDVAGVVLGTALAVGFQGLADKMVDDFCREADRA